MEHTRSQAQKIAQAIKRESDVLPPYSLAHAIDAALGGTLPDLLHVRVMYPADSSRWTITAATHDLIAQVDVSKHVAQWSGDSRSDEAAREGTFAAEVHRIADLRTIRIAEMLRPQARGSEGDSWTLSSWHLCFCDGTSLEIDCLPTSHYGAPEHGEDLIAHVRERWLARGA